VGDDGRHVLPREIRLRLRVLDDHAWFLRPGRPTIVGPPNEYATAGAAERPVRGHTGPVERDVAEEGVAVAVDGNRHVTRDAIVGRYRPLRCLPRDTRISRPRGTRLVLIN